MQIAGQQQHRQVNYLKISDVAKEEIRKHIAKDPARYQGIRVGVKTRGCSGLAYDIQFATNTNVTTRDEILVEDDINIYIDPAASLFLIGAEMDFLKTKIESGFVFKNPNESGRCGCGESFYVDK